jgi:hypothetical protein
LAWTPRLSTLRGTTTGAAESGLFKTAKYLRHTSSFAAGNGLGTTAKGLLN